MKENINLEKHNHIKKGELALRPLITRQILPYNLPGKIKEYPWRSLYKKLKEDYNRELYTIVLKHQSIGGMLLDFKNPMPELVFFEIDPLERGKGYGRASVLLLIDMLKARGYDQIFIQTGRPYIYTGMGFIFEEKDHRGIIIDFEQHIIDFEQHSLNAKSPKNKEKVLAIIFSEKFLIYDHPELPENKERIFHTINRLRTTNLLNKLNILSTKKANENHVLTVHSREYLTKFKEMAMAGKPIGPNCPANPDTFEIALLSFGGALMTGNLVEKHKRIFALCRPPGHHAHRDQAKGFCYLNNMAALAVYLFQKGYRPMIIDWDMHHGDGTQSILYKMPIMFVSIHQKYLYPYSGFEDETGEGKGKGYNVNIMVSPLTKDEEYLNSFRRVYDIADKYKPDIVLISAGQDGAHDDKITGTLLSIQCYYKMASIAREIADTYCNGRLIALLEGGYNLKSLAKANIEIIKGFGKI